LGRNLFSPNLQVSGSRSSAGLEMSIGHQTRNIAEGLVIIYFEVNFALLNFDFEEILIYLKLS